MELWKDLIASSWWIKIFYLLLMSVSSFLTSKYIQYWKTKIFDIDIFIYSWLTSLLFLVFFFGSYWWNYPSAVLSGIVGAYLYTEKVT